MEYKKLDIEHFNILAHEFSKHSLAPIFIPDCFSESLWGIVAYCENVLCGGWVGKIRGDKPLVRFFAKSVWFDHLPVFFNKTVDEKDILDFIKYAREKALNEGIVSLNINHWSRQSLFSTNIFDIKETCATFLIDLKPEHTELYKKLNNNCKRKINKAIKLGVEILILKDQEIMKYLDDFQNLREDTQKRALKKSRNVSMLLKSNNFFIEMINKFKLYLFLASFEGKIASVALMVQSGKTLYYYMGGSDLKANMNSGASTLLMWKAIEFSKNTNLEYFDFGGVPVNPDEKNPGFGVYLFKKSFGGYYKEFSAGKIIVRRCIYPFLNFVLKNKPILRLISKNE